MPDPTSVVVLIWMRDHLPQECKGWLTTAGSEHVCVVPGPGQQLPSPGTSVVVCLDDADKTKWVGSVQTASSDQIEVALSGIQPRFRRYYPRVDMQLAMAWRILDMGPKASEFSKNQTRALKAWWRPASPMVNLSNDGLSFLSAPHLPVGARVQVKLRLPNEQEEHALVAEVVRSARERVPAALLGTAHASSEAHEDEEFSRIALHFPTIPAGAREAISRYMLDWQEQVLEALVPATEVSAHAQDPQADS